MGKILNKCPVCGGKLEYNSLYQYSLVYKILKSGRLSARRVRKEDCGPMECGFITCTNEDCEFMTDCDLKVLDNEVEIDIYTDGETYMYDE